MWTALTSLLGSIGGCVWVINLIPYRRFIFDIGHELTSQSPDTYLPEVIIFIQILAFLIVIPHQAEKAIWDISIFYWARMATMWITTLPSLKEYNYQIPHQGFLGGYNDYLPFSGHMGISAILTLYLAERIYWVIPYGLCFVLAILTLQMRRHYTIELIISAAFARWIYSHSN